MCKAWEDMKAEMLEKGEMIGRAEGEKIGEARGESRGEARGEARGEIRRLQQLAHNVQSVMIKLNYTVEDSLRLLEVSEKDRMAVTELLP